MHVRLHLDTTVKAMVYTKSQCVELVNAISSELSLMQWNIFFIR